MRGVGADIKICIERQFGRVSDAELRSLFQPQVMLRSLNAQNGMPAVRCLSDAGRRKISNWQAYADGFRSGCAANNRDHRRQSLRRPKDRLFVKGPSRVMSESRCPISFGIRKSPARLLVERPGRQFDS